jgi:hypothetical protein
MPSLRPPSRIARLRLTAAQAPGPDLVTTRWVCVDHFPYLDERGRTWDASYEVVVVATYERWPGGGIRIVDGPKHDSHDVHPATLTAYVEPVTWEWEGTIHVAAAGAVFSDHGLIAWIDCYEAYALS